MVAISINVRHVRMLPQKKKEKKKNNRGGITYVALISCRCEAERRHSRILCSSWDPPSKLYSHVNTNTQWFLF